MPAPPRETHLPADCSIGPAQLRCSSLHNSRCHARPIPARLVRSGQFLHFSLVLRFCLLERVKTWANLLFTYGILLSLSYCSTEDVKKKMLRRRRKECSDSQSNQCPSWGWETMAHRVPLHPNKAWTQQVRCYYGHAHVRLPRWSPPLPIFFGSSKKKRFTVK